MEPVAFVLNADYPQRTTFTISRKDGLFQWTSGRCPAAGRNCGRLCRNRPLKDTVGWVYRAGGTGWIPLFLDGLAEGVDLWAADDLIYRKQHGTEVLHLIAVEPCLHYLESRRSGREAMLHYVEHCEAVITIPYQESLVSCGGMITCWNTAGG